MNRPYYPAPVVRPDPRLAARMGAAYREEINRSVTYAYQHLLTEGLDNEASALFYDLAVADTGHAHTLGRLIRALGGDPGVGLRLRTPSIDLTGDASCRALPVVRRMLRGDMQAEATAITELESLSAAASDSAVRSELRAIIADHQEQYQRLKVLLEAM